MEMMMMMLRLIEQRVEELSLSLNGCLCVRLILTCKLMSSFWLMFDYENIVVDGGSREGVEEEKWVEYLLISLALCMLI
jgi:hypothetical protein